MKPEPLKGKHSHWPKGLFYEEDVRSAVEWLLEPIGPDDVIKGSEIIQRINKAFEDVME